MGVLCAAFRYRQDTRGELHTCVCGFALGEEHIEDVVSGTVTEELAEGLFMPGDAVLLDKAEEIVRSVACEGGFREVRVGGEEAFRAGVEVGEVAPASAGDEDLFAGAVCVIEYEHATASPAGVDGAEETGGSCAEDEDVGFDHVVGGRAWRRHNGVAGQ